MSTTVLVISTKSFLNCTYNEYTAVLFISIIAISIFVVYTYKGYSRAILVLSIFSTYKGYSRTILVISIF